MLYVNYSSSYCVPADDLSAGLHVRSSREERPVLGAEPAVCHGELEEGAAMVQSHPHVTLHPFSTFGLTAYSHYLHVSVCFARSQLRPLSDCAVLQGRQRETG